MHAATLRTRLSYGSILLCALVVGTRLPGFATNVSIGALIRVFLFPIALFVTLLVMIHQWESSWIVFRPERRDMRTAGMVLLASVPVAVFITHFGSSLNLISVPLLALVVTSYFVSLYLIILGRPHHALALLLLTLPAIDFLEWDSGQRWRLFAVPIGNVNISITGEFIFVGSLFGAWVTSGLARQTLRLTEPWRYVPPLLLLISALLSIIFLTNNHQLEPALNRTMSVIVFPLLVYVLMIEAIDTTGKAYLMIYCLVAMVVMYTFLAFYMSYRTMPIALSLDQLAANAALVKYATGSPTLKSIELALITPLVLGLLVTATNTRATVLLVALTVYVAVAQLASFNRAGMAAALASTVFFIHRKRTRVLAILALLATVALWNPIYEYGLTRLHNIHSLEDVNLRHLSFARYQGWSAAAGMVAAEPLFGVGINNFGDLAPRFSSPYPALSPEGLPTLLYMSDAHNLFLEVAAEMGLVGLAVLLLFFGLLLSDLLRGFLTTYRTRFEPIGWALLGAYVAVVIISMFGGGFWVSKSSMGHNVLYWTLFALMARLRYIAAQLPKIAVRNATNLPNNRHLPVQPVGRVAAGLQAPVS